MTILLITPDHASHYLPLIAVGREWQQVGEDVVVATGPALKERVRRDGFNHVELELGAGSSSVMPRTDLLPVSERTTIESFLQTSQKGMVATLRYQAEHRLNDLLFQPAEVTERIHTILSEIRPRYVLSVQLAYAATAALLALKTPFASFVTGHPAQVPGRGEVYGYPHVRPNALAACKSELAKLETICREIQDRFTRAFNEEVKRYNPRAAPVPNALATSSPDLVLCNYPEELSAHRSHLVSPQSRFIGSSVRNEQLDENSIKWLQNTDHIRPTVLVSLGSVFSLREDILQRIAVALREEVCRVLFAHGCTDVSVLNAPDPWLVRPHLPLVALLEHCDLVISHGGNNTFTEAITAGVPLLVGPLSSDQFAVASDVERFGLGAVFDPNASQSQDIRRLIEPGLRSRQRVEAVGQRLRAEPGAAKAIRLCREVFGDTRRASPQPARERGEDTHGD